MEQKVVGEVSVKHGNGGVALLLIILGVVVGLGLTIFGAVMSEVEPMYVVFVFPGLPLVIISLVCIAGLKIVGPNEAYVFTFFGKYAGSLRETGFYFVNPFCVAVNNATGTVVIGGKKVSTKAMTLNNDKQKVNDETGNPIEIGVVVIWKVKDTAKAVFNVENYVKYVSIQADASIRHVARQYPYDVNENSDEKTLRGSAQEVAEILKEELQTRVELAGIEIIEARISNLAYAPEIAAAMLQRQQADAIIAARQKIVEGAVSMVEMALNKLSENNICELDDERKAAMVSNLLVVLCGNKDAQPVVNSGSIY